MTSRKSNSLLEYLAHADKYSNLSHEKEIELAKRIERGCPIAREQFILHNLQLVVFVAKQFRRRVCHLGLWDLIQEGNTGLISAVENYDFRFGTRFATFATIRIRDRIAQALVAQEEMVRRSRVDFRKKEPVLVVNSFEQSSGENLVDDLIDHLLNRASLPPRDPAPSEVFWWRVGEIIHYALDDEERDVVNMKLGLLWEWRGRVWKVKYTAPLGTSVVSNRIKKSREWTRVLFLNGTEKLKQGLLNFYGDERSVRSQVSKN